jgi:hypothetical protein
MSAKRIARHAFGVCAALVALGTSLAAAPAGPPNPSATAWRSQVEADWDLQTVMRRDAGRGPVTTKDDALGAVDGIKNGSWAFHTLQDNQPWWQVDLGAQYPLAKALIHNRCDTAARNTRIIVLTSDDGKAWRQVYQHNGQVFYGFTDGKPLEVALKGEKARFLRIQLPNQEFLHLDEVEVYGVEKPDLNLALWKEADQSSVSQWSFKHVKLDDAREPGLLLASALERGHQLVADLKARGVDTSACERALNEAAAGAADPVKCREALPRVRWAVRKLALSNPALDFDSILFVKRVPSSFSHMSDQYYGWWSRPGGGIFVLDGIKSDSPKERCLTSQFPEGNFVDPDLSYDGRKVLFAYCKYFPTTSGLADKMHKENVPEEAFYHIYEMNVDGTGLRQLTHGRYDDFDARYLPSGDIVFLSTRRGAFLQAGFASAQETLKATCPDSYVRCGGDPSRPVAVYTLHTMDGDGGSMRTISAFESFEWSPAVMHDGRIMYARWDYVDRNNMPYMKLWSVNPDGTNPRAVYGNFTTNMHGTFEARCVPASDKILMTVTAHHSITAGTLVMLDPRREFDGDTPLRRLTPEVCFPEIEGWPTNYYVTPYPLAENYYLTAWSPQSVQSQGGSNKLNGPGLYLYDAFGDLELIYRDPSIGSVSPLPLKPRPKPPVIASSVNWASKEGRFLLQDVYDGLAGVARGSIKRLRLVGVPPKVHPNMNFPNLGVTGDDPGKVVLGTVPVAADGSASFRAPSGMSLFFQALDETGMAVQTMRTVTAVQPGETLSCVGCHEARNSTPRTRRVMASMGEPSRITPGPDGTWPFRYDALVQPVLDRSCTKCHRPDSGEPKAAAFNLTAAQSYGSLLNWGNPSLATHVRERYGAGRSIPGAGAAQTSPLIAKLTAPAGHHGLHLQGEDLERLITWCDIYGHRQGSFSAEQEDQLRKLRLELADLLVPGPPKSVALAP